MPTEVMHGLAPAEKPGGCDAPFDLDALYARAEEAHAAGRALSQEAVAAGAARLARELAVRFPDLSGAAIGTLMREQYRGAAKLTPLFDRAVATIVKEARSSPKGAARAGKRRTHGPAADASRRDGPVARTSARETGGDGERRRTGSAAITPPVPSRPERTPDGVADFQTTFLD